MPDFLIICGPTASGKSGVGALLSERLGGEVVSADSMQIYRGLDIGTDKAPEELRRMAPHERRGLVVDPVGGALTLSAVDPGIQPPPHKGRCEASTVTPWRMVW